MTLIHNRLHTWKCFLVAPLEEVEKSTSFFVMWCHIVDRKGVVMVQLCEYCNRLQNNKATVLEDGRFDWDK